MIKKRIFRKILTLILLAAFLAGFLGIFIGISFFSVGLDQANETFFLNIGVFSASVFLIVVFSFYSVRKAIRPLERLKEDVRVIGAGNFDYKIDIKTGDEFEELAAAFNRMAQDLKKYYAALEESKDVLEIRVKARTKEITEMTSDLESKVKERTEGLLKSREALMNMLEDVEEARKKIEQEKNKTEAIVKNFADGLLVFDQENKLSFVNIEAEKILSLKGESILGKSAKDLSEKSSLKPLFELIKTGVEKNIYRNEFKINDDLVIEITSVYLADEEEKQGTLVVLHDITREKLVEKMKTEFVTLAAHQLRTPLSAIKWTLRMVLDQDLGKTNKEQTEFLDDAYESNERMISLINDLLNITRIEEGKYLYKVSTVDFSEIVRRIVDSCKDLAKEKQVKIMFSASDQKIPPISLDEEKIKMTIDNLINNSLRYTPKGGTIKIDLEFNKKEIKFSIKDTGVGIPEDQKKRVFSKFFRGNNVIKMETEGTGLGLFIAKNIIEAHGGKIWYESKENQGTAFYFTLPFENGGGQLILKRIRSKIKE